MAEVNAAAQFMLQEHSRMIDVYQDLHVQKNELLKLYLAFTSIPVSIVAIFLSIYKYLEANAQLLNVFRAFQNAAIYLAILLVFIGFAVLMIMLRIRREQYLYVKAVNGSRKFFRDQHGIDAKEYFALPSEMNEFTFAQHEVSGRSFWEAMIVGFTTSMLLAFLSWQFATRWLNASNGCAVVAAVFMFIGMSVAAGWFVRSRLLKAIRELKLIDVSSRRAGPKQENETAGSTTGGEETH